MSDFEELVDGCNSMGVRVIILETPEDVDKLPPLEELFGITKKGL